MKRTYVWMLAGAAIAASVAIATQIKPKSSGQALVSSARPPPPPERMGAVLAPRPAHSGPLSPAQQCGDDCIASLRGSQLSACLRGCRAKQPQ